MQGYVQVYTGDGKGKTTAALGLALRAVGAGLKVYIGHFVKGMEYSELKSIRDHLPGITVKQFGNDCFIRNKPTDEDRQLARAGLAEMKKIVLAGEHDVVIFDEANIAVHFDLFPLKELLHIIDIKPQHVEIVFTGRKAHPKLMARADLVTEMLNIKHYYVQGVKARPGIES